MTSPDHVLVRFSRIGLTFVLAVLSLLTAAPAAWGAPPGARAPAEAAFYTLGPFSGNDQSTPAGRPFTEPLVAYATGDQDQPVPGVPLTFTIEQGSAAFPGGVTRVTVLSDDNGHATAPTLTAGITPGVVGIRVTAPNFAGYGFFQETMTSATVTRVSGAGMLPLGTENAQFAVDVTALSSAASGTCQLTGDRGTNVRCTSFYEFRRTGATATFRGTALYNNRQPISFTAQVTDGVTDSFLIYGAGQRFGGIVTSGNITIS